MDGTLTKGKRNMVLGHRWKRTDFLIQTLADAAALDGPSHMRGPREQRVLLMKALPAVHTEKAPWDFLSGKLP